MRDSILFWLSIFLVNFAHAQELKLILPIGHTNWVNRAEFSPDGDKVVTASRDETAKIWDIKTGSLLANLEGHTGIVNTAIFDKDGKKIVTSSDDNSAKVWDAISGKLLLTLKGHSKPVNSAVFSPNGKEILTVSNDNTAKIWNTVSGRLIFDLKEHTNKVNTGIYNNDGTKILTTSLDSSAKIWDAVTGKLLLNLKDHNSSVRCGIFSPDQKKIITSSDDNTAKIWDVNSGQLLTELKKENTYITAAVFSPDGKTVVTSSSNNIANVWDASTGHLLMSLKGHTDVANTAIFSPDGTKILSTSYDSTAKIWNAANGNIIATLKGHSDVVWFAVFSSDGSKILTASDDNTSKIWDANSGNLLMTFEGHSNRFYSATFSPDGTKIVTGSDSKIAKIWDANTGSLLTNLTGHNWIIYSAQFSPDGKKVVTASRDHSLKIWDASSGMLLKNLNGHTNRVYTGTFSGDGEKIVSASYDSTVKIWEVNTGKLLINIRGHNGIVNSAIFSPDGNKVLSASSDSTAKIWDANTGKLLITLAGHTDIVNNAIFSSDGKQIVTSSGDSTVKIWDSNKGNLLFTIKSTKGKIRSVVFSPDNKKIAAALNNEILIWDTKTGKILGQLIGHTNHVRSVAFNPNGSKIISSSWDNTCKVWDADNGELLYTFIALDKSDFLIVDKNNRYCGTEAARKMLYYTCGTEIISLEQVKDQLWVPNLAERINEGDSINAPKLSDLHICGLTPLVEKENSADGQYHFKITPRSGGLGETVLYINGNETKRYKPEQLIKTVEGYDLILRKQELEGNFIPGQENPITIKAYGLENDISSRGTTLTIKSENKNSLPPNLFAVMVGISEYKDLNLNLKYAAKDANNLSHAVENAAKKWLDKATDGKEHVFMYDLTTDKNHYLLPEKNSIREVLKDIGKKATANDILLIFFAGHGIMWGDGKKQFYFLTADASLATATSSAVKDVGISAAELADWMQPANIKAQKRILILDACNSGQAINDIVKIGSTNQEYIAARNDDDAEQIKSIDKLNERSGLFILAASATNQSAYEMSRFSQGLLTYALLKTIKEDPAILDNNEYLNIGLWFDHSDKTVTDLVKETGARQQPQIVSTTNFNIGIVDEDVVKSIILQNEKPVFGASNFQNNDENIAADDLELNKLIDNDLSSVSTRDTDGSITFIPGTHTPDAYSINGRYDVKGDSIIVKINVRQMNRTKYKFEISGTKNKYDELANEIVVEALEKIRNKN